MQKYDRNGGQTAEGQITFYPPVTTLYINEVVVHHHGVALRVSGLGIMWCHKFTHLGFRG